MENEELFKALRGSNEAIIRAISKIEELKAENNRLTEQLNKANVKECKKIKIEVDTCPFCKTKFDISSTRYSDSNDTIFGIVCGNCDIITGSEPN